LGGTNQGLGNKNGKNGARGHQGQQGKGKDKRIKCLAVVFLKKKEEKKKKTNQKGKTATVI